MPGGDKGERCTSRKVWFLTAGGLPVKNLLLTGALLVPCGLSAWVGKRDRKGGKEYISAGVL